MGINTPSRFHFKACGNFRGIALRKAAVRLRWIWEAARWEGVVSLWKFRCNALNFLWNEAADYLNEENSQEQFDWGKFGEEETVPNLLTVLSCDLCWGFQNTKQTEAVFFLDIFFMEKLLCLWLFWRLFHSQANSPNMTWWRAFISAYQSSFEAHKQSYTHKFKHDVSTNFCSSSKVFKVWFLKRLS